MRRSNLAFGLLVAFGPLPAAADDGFYCDLALGFSRPKIDSVDGATNDRLNGIHTRAALGIRRGRWALEPNIALRAIDRTDSIRSSTNLRDYTTWGLAAKLVEKGGPLAFFGRGGVHRATAQARGDLDFYDPSRAGWGVAAAVGIQLVTHTPSARLATGLYVEFGYEASWMRTLNTPYERISGAYIAMGIAGGTGF